jgi:DNA-binding MarR family transcriptional regulator
MAVSRFAQPEHSPGFALWQVTRRWQRELGAALGPLGLTHVQFVLLAVAWWAGEHDELPPTQRELAALARTDPMMTSQVLRTLEAKGLVDRAGDAGDRRARRVSVTADGAGLARRAIAVVEEVDARFFAAVPEQAPFERGLAALAAMEERA